MILFDIMKQWIKDNGYDGLFNTEIPCACDLGDFMPCEEPSVNCEPGYRGKDLTCDCESDIKYYIAMEKDSGCPYCE